MLVLSRKIGERVCIGNSVMVTVVAVNSGKVRLAFDAPEDLAIDREEVRGRVREGEVESVANEP